MAKENSITADSVRELLSYNAETGELVWRQRMSSTARPGASAGGIHKHTGYRTIRIFGMQRPAHRIAWVIVHGEWPKGHIDHINGDRSDNRLANLRDVARSVNNQNQRKIHSHKTSCDFLGVCPSKSAKNPWLAQIRVDGRQLHIGVYKTPELAHQAYLEAKRKLHAGCAI
jgi:hypothetical protein